LVFLFFFLSLKEATSLSSLPIIDNKKRKERVYEKYRDKSYEEINFFLSSLPLSSRYVMNNFYINLLKYS